MLETSLQPAGWTVDVYKHVAWPSIVIMLNRVLLRVGYEQASTDVLDVEWRKAMWNAVVVERFSIEGTVMVISITISIGAEIDCIKIGVVDLNVTGTEICHIEITYPLNVGRRAAFVDRTR